jgi:hypothetical protein
MAQQPQLSPALIGVGKGSAVPGDPARVVQPREVEAGEMAVPATPAIDAPPPMPEHQAADEGPIMFRAPPIATEVKRQVSARVPASLDRELRGMVFETGRTQQEIITEFLIEGLKRWRKSRG